MTTQSREFIEAEKRVGGNVIKACSLLQVSRSAFYEWHEHVPSARAVSDVELTEKISATHSASKGSLPLQNPLNIWSVDSTYERRH